MPHYRIRVDDHSHLDLQEDVELANAHRARLEASRIAGDLLRHEAQSVMEAGGCEVTVEDERGLVLFSVLIVTANAPAFPSN